MDYLIAASTLLGGLFLKTEKLKTDADREFSVLDLRGWGCKQHSFKGPKKHQVGFWTFEVEERGGIVHGWKVSELRDGKEVENYFDDPWLRDWKGEAHVIFLKEGE